MPHLVHIVESEYKPSFRSEKVASMFDVPVADKLRKSWDVNLPIEEKPWQIGLITGASGSGKTILSKRLFDSNFHNGFEWHSNCLLDDFPKDCDLLQITSTLSRVGFASPPSWLLPYSALSNGQKFRAELARCLLEYENLFVFDEFTSVVDRQVAQISCHAFQKAIRKTDKSFVAVTCHNDVEEWLQPDWVFDVSSNQFKWGSLRRPEIKLEICRVNYKAWHLFKEHHYLSADLNRSAICFAVFIQDRPVAFSSWISHVGALPLSKDQKGAMRSHRKVTLPDFQGLGIGKILFLELCKMWKGLGYRVFASTSHPGEVQRKIGNPEWRITRIGRSSPDRRVIHRATNRLLFHAEYVGPALSLEDSQQLLNK